MTSPHRPGSKLHARLIPALISMALVLPVASARAGGNSGAQAYLTWSATDKAATDLATPGSLNYLYIYVERATALSFHGAEFDLTWNPPGDPDVGCFGHVSTAYKTSSGTTCTYLNRGSAVPVVVADDPGHLHIAWANTTSLTSCTAGAIIQVGYQFDGCVDPRGCLTLNSVTLLDANNLLDAATVAGASVTVLGGSGFCPGANHPPVLAPIGPRSVEELQTLAFNVSASDPDLDPLTYAAAPLPAGATFVGQSFSWTPGLGQSGDYDVLFTATDPDGAADSELVTISVGQGNQPPVLDPIGPHSVRAGSTLSFDLTASDPNGDPLTFSAGPLPSGATLVGQAFSWTPTADQMGDWNVTFYVSDPSGASDSEAVTLSVTAAALSFYVDPTSGCSSCDGRTWQSAVHSIGAGLALAQAGAGDSIKVAEGRYAEQRLTPPTGAFLVGGYPAGGGKRNAQLHKTTIEPPATQSENLLLLTNASVTIDGLIVRGVEDGASAVYVSAADVTLRSCVIVDNHIRDGLPVVLLDVDTQSARLERCLIAYNVVQTFATVFWTSGTSGDIVSCDLVADSIASTAPGSTAGIHVDGHATVTVTNTILYFLRPKSLPAITTALGANLDVTYSDVVGGWTGTGNIDADPRFCDLRNGRLSLHASSPCIGAGMGGSTIGAIGVGCPGTMEAGAPDAGDGVSENEPVLHSAVQTVVPTLTSAGVRIDLALRERGPVTIDVFEPSGRLVRRVASDVRDGGRWSFTWDGRAADGLPVRPGIYLLRVQASELDETRRVCVIR